MRKAIKTLFLLFLIFLISSDLNLVSSETLIEIDSSGNYYFDYESNDTTTYYSSLSGLSGDSFKSELHKIISSGNITKYSYEDVTAQLKILDEDPNNPNNIICILTGKSLSKNNFGGNGTLFWNREHIWPKAHGFNNDSLAPYTDLHHLRAAEQYTNSTYHNERDYGEIAYGGTSDQYGNKYVKVDESPTGYPMYEPRDAIKGDIARIIMYMDVRYEGDSASDGIELIISNDKTDVSSSVGYIGLLDVLLKWHEEDPVDDLERKRNDMTYNLQGNRNPFIDHPEYANKIYGTQYDDWNDNEYRVLYYATNGTFKYIDTNNYNANDFVAKPSNDPVSNRYDYEFAGWATSDGETFDFANDKITSDLKLYAQWKYTPIPVEQMFERTQTMSALHMIYTMKDIDPEPVIKKTTMTITTDFGSQNLRTNQSYSYDDYMDYNKKDLKITYETNSKGYVYISGNIIRLYPGSTNGTALKIEAREGSNAKILDISFKGTAVKADSGNTINNMLKETVAEDKSYAYLQNIVNDTKNNQVNISSIEITYYTETTTTKPVFEEVRLVFGLELPNDYYKKLVSSGSSVKVGFLVDGVNYDNVNVEETSAGYKITCEVMVSNYSKTYQAKAYVNIDGVKYYSIVVSQSAKSLANLYLLEHLDNSSVYENRIALVAISNN